MRLNWVGGDYGRFYMKKIKPIVARNAAELAALLGMSPADAVEMQVRRRVNEKLIAAVAKSGLTHLQVAKLARTSHLRD